MNKLIVVEGLDGCGKTTQLEMLREKLPQAHFISFPNYESESGRLISSYLKGGFAEPDNRRSAYSASVMYAIDRYTSFRTHWGALYNSEHPVISARYVSSNAIYQMTKLDRAEWSEYLSWLCDLEYEKLGMPRPDLTVFLNMPTEISQKLLLERYGGDESKRDIHERDIAYLKHCRDAAVFVAEKYGWETVQCSENGAPRSREAINADIISLINNSLD